MQKIFPLPDSVVTKIAAGEVIERPAYAVKELIENAIDAGANDITIHIEESGLRKITVIDNGEGMSREDLQICFLPHTTSKIKSEDELLGIKTLGFRGEALSAIAAVANITIKSRTADSPGGTVVTVKAGTFENIAPVGTPIGTTVIIDNLFYPVPARKKFLKTERTEFRLLTEIVMHFVVSFPNIHFTLIHNGNTLFDTPKQNDSFERVKLLLGNSLFEHLIPLHYEEGYIKLSGFIAKPQSASKHNQKQFLFVNNRHVTNRLIALAVKESFGTLLPASYTPVFILHLTIPHELVDVNVHPRKEHVTFINNDLIFDSVRLAVTQTLADHNLTFNLTKFKQETSSKIGETTSFVGQLLKETVLPWNKEPIRGSIKGAAVVQIHDTYVCTQTKEGIVLIDQHAAHERILYEQFVSSFATEKKKKQFLKLAKAFRITLGIAELQILDEYRQLFISLGFTFMIKDQTVTITQIPAIFKGRKIEPIIKDMLSDLANDITNKKIDLKTQRMLVFLSCRAAIKAGESLSEKQARDLIGRLEKTPNNSTCPHGRPTKLLISLPALDKLFRRK